MNNLITRRKVLGGLVAIYNATLISACGGGSSGSTGSAVDAAEVNAQKNTTASTTAFAVTSPAQNATASSTFTVSGTAGTQWVNVAIYSGSTKLSSDVTPAGGKWSATVTMGTLTGAQTLMVMAFSVAPGQSGGTSTSASLTVTITDFAVTSPAQNASATSTFTMSGTAGTQWINVAVYSGSTKLSSDVTPAGGKWSATVTMGTLTGAQTLTVMAFSVAPGQSGGTSTSASLNVTIGAAAVTTPAAGVLPYFGINAHYVQGGVYQSIPLAQQVSLMTANGMTTCRQDCYDQPGMTALANTVIPGMKGITVLPVVASTPTGSSVSSAYTQGYQLGVAAANTFAGLVPVIEMGNEYDEACVNNNVDGTVPSNFNSTAPLYVAYQAGLCNGFRSVDTTGKTKVMLGGIAYIHFGFLEMIVKNIQPDGSAMSTAAATFDMIAWHYYYTGGNMESVSGLSGTYNVFTSIAQISTKPIYFSECGIGQRSEERRVGK